MPEGRPHEVAQVVVSDLAALDGALGGDGPAGPGSALHPDTLALFAYAQALPMGGINDLVDWRLCGAIGQAQARGYFSGAPTEQLLVPGPHRLGLTRVLVFGLGPKAELTEPALARRLGQALTAVAQAGCRRLAWAVPKGPHPEGCAHPEAAFMAAAAAPNGHIIGKLLLP